MTTETEICEVTVYYSDGHTVRHDEVPGGLARDLELLVGWDTRVDCVTSRARAATKDQSR